MPIVFTQYRVVFPDKVGALVIEEFLPARIEAFKDGSSAQEVVLGYDRVFLRIKGSCHLVHRIVAVSCLREQFSMCVLFRYSDDVSPAVSFLNCCVAQWVGSFCY